MGFEPTGPLRELTGFQDRLLKPTRTPPLMNGRLKDLHNLAEDVFAIYPAIDMAVVVSNLELAITDS